MVDDHISKAQVFRINYYLIISSIMKVVEYKNYTQ